MAIIRRSEISRCPLCLRSKEEAITEQSVKGVDCGHQQCAFKKEISQVIYTKSKLAHYCGECGNKFASEEELYCPECGKKRISL